MYIDQVFIDLKNHSNLFTRVRKQAWTHAWNQAYKQARGQLYCHAHIQAWEQVYDQARDQAYFVAQDALLALFVYDDTNKYLIIPADQAIVYGELVGDNQYILIKPYLLVKNEIASLLTT
jgi:hypothetical protein